MQLSIEYKDPLSLIPYANNAKVHEEEQINQIAASIKEFGFNNPILLDGDNGVIAGHGRLRAAVKLVMDSVPTIELGHLSDIQKKAYVLADNRLAEVNTSWDFDLVSLELEALESEGSDIDLTGFDSSFIIKQIEDGKTDEDDVPDAPDDPVTVLGDVWVMGEHRVMCGDSTSIDAFQALTNGVLMDFCITSPPYNGETAVGFKQGKPGGMKTTTLYADNKTDSKTDDEYIQFNADVINNISLVASDDFICCYNISYNKKSPDLYIDVAHEIKKSIPLVETIVWEKHMAISLAGDNLTRIVEFIFVLCKGKIKINKEFRDSLKNLWKISNVGANTETHKACFPIALAEKSIRTFAPHGANIIEPFCGSGSTVIAAEKTGCRCHGLELSENYTDVIVMRWQEYTGKQATLENDGRTFEEIKNERIQ